MPPALFVLSLFWFTKGRFLVQDSEGGKLNDRESECTTDQRIGVLTQALQTPDHPVHKLIETKITEITKINEQSAAMDLVRDEIARIDEFYRAKAEDLALAAMARATEYYKDSLANAKKRSVANEEKMTSIEDRLHVVQQQVQGQLPEAICRKIASIINSMAKTTIEKADQERFRKLASTTSNADHELLEELQNKVLGYDESLQGLAGLPAEISELKVGVKQQMDDLRSAISGQDESIVKLVDTHTLPRAQGTDAEVLSKLQDKIDNHDTQLQSFTKMSNDLGELETEVKTFAKSLRQLSAVVSTVQAMEISLQKHDGQIMELNGASANVETSIKQHEQLEQKIGQIEKNVSREASSHEIILAMQGKIEKVETSLAELGSVRSQVGVLGERTTSFEDRVAHQEELLKQLKVAANDVDNMTARSKAYDDMLNKLHTNVNKLAEDFGSIKGLATIIENHGEQLEYFQKWANEDSKAVKELERITVNTAVDSPPSVSASTAAVHVLPASGAPAKDPQHPSPTSETHVLQGEDVSQTSIPTDLAATATIEDLEDPLSTPENDATPAPNAPAPLLVWSKLSHSVPSPSAGDSNSRLLNQYPDPYTSGSDTLASKPNSPSPQPPTTTPDAHLTPSSTQTSPPQGDARTSTPTSPAATPAAASLHDETMNNRPGHDETGIPEPSDALEKLLADLGEERADGDLEVDVEHAGNGLEDEDTF
ncbi:uncharacterized protein EKO05_0002985 [Ascochyta rabiei]|uniref:Uncharacterized protein n=1 Tax=Didymella rabiei TaxID=5454 RepID=A0A162X6C3_DIDRA|nr:uncharacterized protein EKO05_0002985 [Ascochyta rabiei]KZM19372.1 hypothetical protein ST47_g9467 [Ascochyta rabiei]UPX12437.1 hypothetical protein EKO05_0002985 [Ascochyta rabiei]